MPDRARQLIAVIGALVSLNGTCEANGTAELIHTYRWSADIENFGGYSGLWVSDDGSAFKTVSDRGRFVEGTFQRRGDAISDVAVERSGDIRERLGREAPDGFMEDAEGLDLAPDGSIILSFEGHHRVRRWTDFREEPELLHPIRFFYHLQSNSGFEAVTVDADGVIYAVPERSGRWEKPFPVWRLRAGVWDDELSLRRRDRYLVVGADFGPDGRLYLLEREFTWYAGFRNRIRRFVLRSEGFDDGTTLLETEFAEFDNFEGISVWQAADGRLVATLISDDNFSPLQATVIAEFRLPD